MKVNFKKALLLLLFFSVQPSFTAEESVDVHEKDETGSTLLHKASLAGEDATVALLILQNANINEQNKADNTPLTLAALNGHNTVVERLLKACANPNSRNLNNDTPLMRAAYGLHDETVKILLDNRADSYAINKNDESAWAIALIRSIELGNLDNKAVDYLTEHRQ